MIEILQNILYQDFRRNGSTVCMGSCRSSTINITWKGIALFQLAVSSTARAIYLSIYLYIHMYIYVCIYDVYIHAFIHMAVVCVVLLLLCNSAQRSKLWMQRVQILAVFDPSCRTAVPSHIVPRRIRSLAAVSCKPGICTSAAARPSYSTTAASPKTFCWSGDFLGLRAGLNDHASEATSPGHAERIAPQISPRTEHRSDHLRCRVSLSAMISIPGRPKGHGSSARPVISTVSNPVDLCPSLIQGTCFDPRILNFNVVSYENGAASS